MKTLLLFCFFCLLQFISNSQEFGELNITIDSVQILLQKEKAVLFVTIEPEDSLDDETYLLYSGKFKKKENSYYLNSRKSPLTYYSWIDTSCILWQKTLGIFPSFLERIKYYMKYRIKGRKIGSSYYYSGFKKHKKGKTTGLHRLSRIYLNPSSTNRFKFVIDIKDHLLLGSRFLNLHYSTFVNNELPDLNLNGKWTFNSDPHAPYRIIQKLKKKDMKGGSFVKGIYTSNVILIGECDVEN